MLQESHHIRWLQKEISNAMEIRKYSLRDLANKTDLREDTLELIISGRQKLSIMTASRLSSALGLKLRAS